MNDAKTPVRSKSDFARNYSTYGILKDGRSILLRAVRAEDADEVNHKFQREAPTSFYRSFFGSREFSESGIRAMCSPDWMTQVTLVAVMRDQDREEILGITRYWTTPETAETKRAKLGVIVVDRVQGIGIGTLLVENLANIAYHVDILEFEMLAFPENEKLTSVLSGSGMLLRTEPVGEATKAILTTERTTRFMSSHTKRNIASSGESIRRLLNPASVALIGASRKPNSIGKSLLANIKQHGYTGALYLVNPSAAEIDGMPCYKSVRDIPAKVDLGVIAVPAPLVKAVVEECVEAKVGDLVIISSGFAEVSQDGRVIERQLKEMVRSAGMRMVGPNCMGILNTRPGISLDATFAPPCPTRGNVGMLSQSGALGLAILDYAHELNIGMSSFVSVGNKTDVSGNDLLSFWYTDPETDVIALYLESFGDPRRFARIAPIVAREKPIVAVKSGRSAAGSRAASSHSAALANADVAVDALFKEAGVIRTNTLEELFDVVALLSSQPSPRGPSVGVLTNAGGPGILLADALEGKGLSVPTLREETIRELRSFLPSAAGFANPIDMIASATPDHYRRAIKVIANDSSVDSLIVIYVPPMVSEPEAVATAIAEAAADVPADKPLLTVYLCTTGAPPQLNQGPRGKIPTFSFPENAAQALASAEWYSRWRQRPVGTETVLDRVVRSAIREVIDSSLARQPEAHWLEPKEVEALLRTLGIQFARSVVAEPDGAVEAAEALGYPLVAKAVSPDVVHKSDIGAVIMGLESEHDVRLAVDTLRLRLKAVNATLGGVMLQEEIRGGIEAIVGVTTDPVFGAIVLAGLGGTQVELLKDVSFGLPPVTDYDATEMLDNLRAKKLLDGFRGSAPGDREALISVITRISALVEIVPEIIELDLNPVKVLLPGKGAVVVDSRIKVKPV